MIFTNIDWEGMFELADDYPLVEVFVAIVFAAVLVGLALWTRERWIGQR